MATQVQFRGGTTTQNDAFTGAAREVTVDTTKDTLVVHDGTTQGGFPLLGEIGSQTIKAPDKGNRYYFEATDTEPAQLSLYDASDAQTTRISADTAYPTFFGTNVGIGTTSPSGLLHLSGDTCQLHFTDEDDSSSSRIYQSGVTFTIDIDQADAKASSVLAFRIDDAEAMRLDSSGSLLIGGTLPASPATTITAAGAITAAGNVQSGDADTHGGSDTGVTIKSSGLINATRATGSNIFAGFKTGDATQTSQITSDGDATFEGKLEVQDEALIDGDTTIGNYDSTNGGTSGVQLQATGAILAQKQNDTDVLWYGMKAGTTNSKITASGAAEFAADLFSIAKSADTRIGTDSITISGTATRSKVNIDPGGWVDGNSDVIPPQVAIYAPVNAEDAKNVWVCFDNNTTGTSSTINVGGDAWFAGDVTVGGTISDIRFKENITDAKSQLDDVVALGSQLKNWDWKTEAPVSEKIKSRRFLGIIAQDAEKVCPEVSYSVSRTKDGAELTPESTDEEGNVTPATYEELDDSFKAIKHDVLLMKLLGAVAELSVKVAALEAA